MTQVRTFILVLAVLLPMMLAYLLISTVSEAIGIGSVIAGDPTVYEQRWQEIMDGNTPYLQAEFEHFPLTLLQIGAASLLSDALEIGYTAAFAITSTLLIVATALIVRQLSLALGDDSLITRFLLALAPLVPLALFRTDLLAVTFAAAALLAAIRSSSNRSILYDTAGILTKGWPVVRGLTEWWQGRRTRAIVVLVIAMVTVVTLLLTPGFQSGRTFEGVQIETISGSVTLIARHLTGTNLGILERAGSLYIDTGAWAIAVNMAIGVPLAIVALRGVKAPFTWRRGALLLAAVVTGVLVASPLLSAQFLLWPLVYLAVAKPARVLPLFVVCGLITTSLIGFWDPGAPWWAALLVLRNSLLLTLAALLAIASARHSTANAETRSLQ